VSVTIVTSVYGSYGAFLDGWEEAVAHLDPAPDRVIISGDRHYPTLWADHLVSRCTWRYPQAYYQHQAVMLAETDWVWLVDVDDFVMLDALRGLDDVDADVWQLGFLRSDGERYLPPKLSNADYLALDHNPYVGASMFRVEAFRAVGGFPDVALQDWALWHRLARVGYTFEASGRVHFHYMRHATARGSVELTADRRAAHTAEMLEHLVA